MGIGFGRNMLILATRGCPYQCTFCSNPEMWTTRYVMRPAVEVVDESEYLLSEYGVNSVDFADLTAIVKSRGFLNSALNSFAAASRSRGNCRPEPARKRLTERPSRQSTTRAASSSSMLRKAARSTHSGRSRRG